MSGNLFERVAATVEEHPHRPAIFFEGTRLDYARLGELTGRFAGLLRAHGVEPGDRVAVMLPNSAVFVAAFHATLQVGGIVVPLNILLRPAEVDQRFENSTPRVLLISPELEADFAETAKARGAELIACDVHGEVAERYDRVEEIVPRETEDVGIILYTSGTTGRSKGAELTHAGLTWNADGIVNSFAIDERDVQFGAAPLSHVLGLTGIMNATLFSGGAMTLMQRFEAAAGYRLLVETGTTVVMGAPTMCFAILAEAAKTDERPPLRLLHIGGAALPVETARALAETFPGAEVREGFGMTETSGGVCTTALGTEPKAGSVGTGFSDGELRVVSLETREPLPRGETGEVQVRSRGVMRGYRDDPEATAEVLDPERWFSTGDIGYIDEDGYLYLVDRKKELILRGGYNVYPREVEEVLYAHPGVHEATVIGIPHPTHGEEVVALVVPREGVDLDPEAVKAFARERVAAYKYPRHVVVVDDLPKGPTGKIFKRGIDRDELVRSLEAQPSGTP